MNVINIIALLIFVPVVLYLFCGILIGTIREIKKELKNLKEINNKKNIKENKK